MTRAGAPSPVELLDAARALPPGERAAYLDHACGGDASLRAEVESLLAHLDAAGGFLETGPFREGETLHRSAEAAAGAGALLGAMTGMLRPGAMVSRYRVVRPLGEGGMGLVYEAQQENPGRRVALKVMRPVMGSAGAALVRRFQHEAQLLGRLQHPGIAQIFEAGTAQVPGLGSVPFLAMELVGGTPLAAYAAERRLQVPERLELVARVCDAVEHAHQRGLVHRDLKPGNILVDGTGQPKVLDFGVARLLDSAPGATMATTAGQLVGTLAYMSPEQVAGRDVDARSDVYALGVILYELLAGRPPHEVQGRTILEASRAIREDDPGRLSGIDRIFRGDIETIALKALEKDPGRRYQSAAALADDLRRHLGGEPILAKQDSALYLIQKQLRRYRWAVAVGVVFTVMLAAFAVWAAAQARAYRELAKRESAAKTDAIEQGRNATEQLRLSNLERGRLQGSSGDLLGAEELLWPAFAERQDLSAYWALWELYWRVPCERVMGHPEEAIRSLCPSPDGQFVVTAGFAGTVTLWDHGRGRAVWAAAAGNGELTTVRFSPGGGLIATAGGDGTIRFFAAADGSPRGEPRPVGSAVSELEFISEDSLLTVGTDSVIREWDVAGGRALREIPLPGESLRRVRVHPHGGLLAVADLRGAVFLVELASGRVLTQLQAHTASVLGLDWRPDGGALVTSSSDGTVALWNTDGLSPVAKIDSPAYSPREVRFSPDGSKVVATCTFATVVLDGRTLAVQDPRLPEIQGGWGAFITPDGERLIASGYQGALRVWRLKPPPCLVTIRPHAGEAAALAASPDGRTIATGGDDGRITLLDPETGAERTRWDAGAEVRWLDFAPAGDRLAAALAGGRIAIFDARNGERLGTLPGHGGGTRSAVFTPDGRLASGGEDGAVRLWDAAAGKELAVLPGTERPILGLALSLDGRRLAATTRGATAVVWDLKTLEIVERNDTLPAGRWHPAFGPGDRLTAGAFGGSIVSLPRVSAGPVEQWTGHRRWVRRVLAAPGGEFLVTVSQDGLIKLWDPEAGRAVATLRGSGGEAASGVLVPGSLRLAVSYKSGEVEIWDLGFYDRHIRAAAGYHARRIGLAPGAAPLAAGLGAWSEAHPPAAAP